MSISADVQSLDPGAIIELFVLDATSVGGTISYFHAGTNQLAGSVVWQGTTYQPWPIQVRGFDKSTQGQLPRPTMTLANVDGTIGAMAAAHSDLLGATVTRKRTLAKYLDASNFASGVNSSADPNAYFPDDVFTVDRKSAENKNVIEFELAAKMDLAGVSLPRRVCSPLCAWVYKGTECGYSGGPVADLNDVATTDPAKDQCGKRLTSCRLRFGSTAALPFGGFPGTRWIR